MAQMRCYNCGAEFDGRFCPYCGCPAPEVPPQPPKKKKTGLVIALIVLAVAIVVSGTAAVVSVLDNRSSSHNSLRDHSRDRDEDEDEEEEIAAAATEAPAVPATEAPAVPATEAPAAPSVRPDDVTVSESQLYNKGGVTVTVKRISHSSGNYELHFSLSNDSDQKVTVSSEDVSINNCMVDSILYCELDPGKKANESMYIFSDELDRYGILTIGEIAFDLRLYNSETYATIDETDTITVRTSAYGTFQQEVDDSGEVIYDKGGIRIISKGFYDAGYMGPTLSLYVENNSGSSVIIMSEGSSINGYMTDDVLYVSLRPGTVDIADMWFNELEEIGVYSISDIEELEFQLEILDSNTYYEVGNTGTITLYFN